MLSSISNSEMKSKSWLYSWLLVLVVFVATLTAYEYFLYNRGFVASIENNKDLWSGYRGKITGKNNALVIVGASRSQLDVNISYLKTKLNKHEVTQLSINGQYPLATIKAIAADKDFDGTLIVALNAQALESKYLDMQAEHNRYYADQSTLNKSFDAYLTAILQSRFRFLHPLLGVRDLVDFYAVNKKFKDVFYTTANIDQSVSADYSKADVAGLLKHFVANKEENYKNEPPSTPRILMQNIELLQGYVKRIENRGGRVILVRFPTDKGHWLLDEEYYPRRLYWDAIERNSDLITVHFNDVVGLNQIDLPDSSHVDQKDTIEFTELLFDHLIEAGLLD
jgi:hypothetical protein